MKKWWKPKYLYFLIAIIFIVSSMTVAFANSNEAIPKNPIEQSLKLPNTNLMVTSYDGEKETESSKGQSTKDEEIKSEKNKSETAKNEDQTKPEEFKEEATNDHLPNGTLNNPSKNEQSVNQNKEEQSNNNSIDQNNGTTSSPNSGNQTNQNSTESGSNTDEDSDDVIIVDGDQDENPYFITSINNGETVSEEDYAFSITHKHEKAKVLSTIVTVNSAEVEDFTGTVQLMEGENRIAVTVIYDEPKKTVTRKYTVYFAKNDIVFNSTLKKINHTSEQQFSFQANAHYNDESVPIEAFMNGISLTKKSDGSYTVALQEGEQIVELIAHHNGQEKKAQYAIIYEKKQSKIEFLTDLENGSTTNAEITFYAEATVDDENIPMSATLNGEKLKEYNHLYSDLLKEGKNLITISASNGEDHNSLTYTIYYKKPADENNGSVIPDDKNGPIITTDLKNNLQVHGTKKNFNVWATTSDGVRIQASGVTVHNNGKAVPVIWDDSEKTSYRLDLQQGKNTVVIKAWDKEGRLATKTYIVYAKNLEGGDPIGTITMSIQAPVVGLPTIIAPQSVPIYEGVNGAYILDQFLKKNGFGYTKTGTLDAAFYLASISKPGLTTNLKVPDDLVQKIENSTLTYDWTNYDPNSLGEFDLTSGSGWVYSVNGDFPNYGFADARFQNGDVVKIQFTLMYGKDTGFANGGGAIEK